MTRWSRTSRTRSTAIWFALLPAATDAGVALDDGQPIYVEDDFLSEEIEPNEKADRIREQIECIEPANAVFRWANAMINKE